MCLSSLNVYIMMGTMFGVNVYIIGGRPHSDVVVGSFRCLTILVTRNFKLCEYVYL